MNSTRQPYDRTESRGNIKKETTVKQRYSFIDQGTQRYIGLISGKPVLMGEVKDELKQPFIWHFGFGIFNHMPRKGEYINMQNLPFDVKVVDIKHNFTVGSARPPHIYFYVNFTDEQRLYNDRLKSGNL